MSSWRPWAYGPWTPRPYELVIKAESRASSVRLNSSGSSRQPWVFQLGCSGLLESFLSIQQVYLSLGIRVCAIMKFGG